MNDGDGPRLREAWATFHYAAPEAVANSAGLIALVQNDIVVPAGATSTTEKAACEVSVPLFVRNLVGHGQPMQTRLSVWRRSLTQETLVYETYGGSPALLEYRTDVDNPAPRPPEQPGGFSGFVSLAEGGRWRSNASTKMQVWSTWPPARAGPMRHATSFASTTPASATR